MPAQLKRPASAMVKKTWAVGVFKGGAAGEPKAKRQQEDPIVSKCHAITSLLATAEGYQVGTLDMLAGAAQSCLAVPKEQRHHVQDAVLEMIAEVLSSIESGHIAKVAALRGKIAEADGEKATREAVAEAAAAKCEERSDAAEAADTALKTSGATIEAAEQELKVATSEQKVGDADLDMAEGKKASAESLVTADLLALKDGTAANIAESVSVVSKIARGLQLEEQLISSAEVVLSKAPGERGGFDGMVMQQLDQQFNDAIAQLAEQLATGEAGKAARAAKVGSCRQRQEDAVAHEKGCQEHLQASHVACEEAEAARRTAEKSILDLGPELEAAAASAEAADAVLVACRADLATFRELVEGSPVASEAAIAEVPASKDPMAEQPADATRPLGGA